MQQLTYNAAAGFNLTLEIMGTNRTVHGNTSQLPAASLQPVQPQWQAATDRHNITMRLQGPDVVPFTADLQRELVSAVLHVSPDTFAALATLFHASLKVIVSQAQWTSCC